MYFMEWALFVLLIVSHFIASTAFHLNLTGDNRPSVFKLQHSQIPDNPLQVEIVHVCSCHLHCLDNLVQVLPSITRKVAITPTKIIICELHQLPNMVPEVMEVWLILQVLLRESIDK